MILKSKDKALCNFLKIYDISLIKTSVIALDFLHKYLANRIRSYTNQVGISLLYLEPAVFLALDFSL